MKRTQISVLLGSLFCGLLLALSPAPAVAAPCPDPNRDGRTIGRITVGSTSVDVKTVTYPAGGELLPPRSPLNVGLSVRHAPLKATEGSSVLVWHINYAGCIGKLNVINNRKPGSRISVIDEEGVTTQYVISSTVRVPKGKYRPEWFRLDGPRQLVFVTCVGVVVDGHYLDNLVIIAKPAT